MGVFGAIAASKALAFGVGEVGSVVVGVVGAIGGGLLRDLLLNLPISILQVGTLYAVAAAAGSSSLVLLDALAVPVPVSGLVCVVVTAAVRVGALRFGWMIPEQRAVRLRRGGA